MSDAPGMLADEVKLPGIMQGDVPMTPRLARAVGAITDSPARIEATQLALADALRRKTEPTSEEPNDVRSPE